MDGSNQLICCSVDGEVRGYQNTKHRELLRTPASVMADTSELKELSLLKQNLLIELGNYEREIDSLNSSQKFSLSERVENAIIPVSAGARVCVRA